MKPTSLTILIVLLSSASVWADGLTVAPRGTRAMISKAYSCGVRGISGSTAVTFKGGSFRLPMPGYRTIPMVEIPKGTATTVEQIRASVGQNGSLTLHGAQMRFSRPIKIKENAVPFLKEMVAKGAVKQSMTSRLGLGVAGIFNPKDIKILELSFAGERGGQMKVGGKIRVLGVTLKLQPQSVSAQALSGMIGGDLTRRLAGIVGGQATCNLRATTSQARAYGLRGQATAAMDLQNRTLTLQGTSLTVSGARDLQVRGDLSATMGEQTAEGRRVSVRTPALKVTGVGQRTIEVSGNLSARLRQQPQQPTQVEADMAVKGLREQPIRISGSASTTTNPQARSVTLQQANLQVSGQGIGRAGTIGVTGGFTASSGEQGPRGRKVVVNNTQARITGLTERPVGVTGSVTAWIKPQQRSASASPDLQLTGLPGREASVGIRGRVAGSYNATDRSLSLSDVGVKLVNFLGANRTIELAGRLPRVQAKLGEASVSMTAAGLKIRNVRAQGDEIGVDGSGSFKLKPNQTVGFTTRQMDVSGFVPGKKVKLRNTSGDFSLAAQ